ncbi:hypothetical protein BH23ACT10_BH23ACT10_40260 [soil metagenome]
MPGETDLPVRARRALLDALDALVDHSASVVLVGAQAVYLRTGDIDLALAPATKDADLALDPRGLAENPRVEVALQAAGFRHESVKFQPGAWISADGMPVDILVPEQLAGPAASGRRGARLPPHDRRAMRRTVGLEGCVVDNTVLTIGALHPDDPRAHDIRVAGAAALIVAKTHKISERIDTPGRDPIAKDAHDLYRLLVASNTEQLAMTFAMLLAHEVSAEATATAVRYLAHDFSNTDAPGAQLAGAAERAVGDPVQVSAATALLTSDLIDAIGEGQGRR